MVDEFGRLVRNIRLVRGLLLYDMARSLGISSAKLSAIECGTEPIPKWFIPALREHYQIGDEHRRLLVQAAKDRGDYVDVK